MSIIRKALQQQITPSAATVISEEAIDNGHCTAEVAIAGMQIEQSFEAINRYEDTCDALEATADVAMTVENADNSHLALVDCAIALSIAGENASPEQVVLSNESVGGVMTSPEGIREFVKNIWEAIKAQLAKVAKWAKSFWHNLFGDIPVLQRQLIAVKKRANDAVNKTTEEKDLELGKEANALATNYKLDKKFNLLATVEGYSDTVDALYDRNVSDVAGLFKTVMELFDLGGEGDIQLVEDGSEKLIELAKKFLDAKSLGNDQLDEATNGSKNDESHPLNGYKGSFKQLAGNKSLVSVCPDPIGVTAIADGNGDDSIAEGGEAAKTKVAELVSASKRIRKSGFAILDYDSEGKLDALEEATVPVLSPNAVLSIADALTNALAGIEKYQTSKAADKAAKDCEKIKKAGDKLAKSTDKDENTKYSALRNELKQYATAYSKWTTQPQTGLASNVLATTRASLIYMNKSLSTYKAR